MSEDKKDKFIPERNKLNPEEEEAVKLGLKIILIKKHIFELKESLGGLSGKEKKQKLKKVEELENERDELEEEYRKLGPVQKDEEKREKDSDRK